jgi:hypothetical protein
MPPVGARGQSSVARTSREVPREVPRGIAERLLDFAAPRLHTGAPCDRQPAVPAYARTGRASTPGVSFGVVARRLTS